MNLVRFAHVSSTSWMSLILMRLARFRSGAMALIGLPGRDAATVRTALPHRPRILVVDDCAVNQLAVSALLWRWGITPLVAGDGAEALALACGHDFDLILMDLQMPTLDGLSATKQLRRFEVENARPRVPVVAYTSSCVDGQADMLKTFGIDATLEKPCSAETLEHCLTRWWGHDLQILA